MIKRCIISSVLLGICLGIVGCANVNVSGLIEAAASGDTDKLKQYGKEYAQLRKKKTLTLADIEPKLAKLSLGDIEFNGVKYLSIGVPEYDKFFRSAAKLDGLVRVTRKMTNGSTKNLKNYAISKVANAAMQDNIQGLVGNKPPERWTRAEQISVMKMARAQGEISDDEKRYFARTAGNLAIASGALLKGIDAAYDLSKTGYRLQKTKTVLKDAVALAAAEGFTVSLKNLDSVTKNGPPMAEEITVLIRAFNALGN